MTHPILGLHHVTATVDAAQLDVDFSVGVLGLRLVKKTVNFDNHHVYHFYYGDERGTPGTIWTTFPYRDKGVRVGTKGAGQVTVTSFSVPEGSLGFWKERLRAHNVPVKDVESRFGEEAIATSDPSGLAIELVANDADGRRGWPQSGVGRANAIRGLHSVSLVSRAPAKTVALLTEILGFRTIGESAGRTRLAVRGGEPGQRVDIVHQPDAPSAVNGLGTVHHVALAIADAAAQLALREELIQLGYGVTEVRDRQYFLSIYFREPGGVLFEAATLGPGFTVDELLESLGENLKLPPWEEPARREIEAGLPRLSA